jgi:hypothetical protein
METQTIVATVIALLGAALVTGLGYYARKELGLKQWQTAVDYAELVVNSIDKLYEDGQVVKDQRLQTAMNTLTTRCPWLKSEDAHTLIHGWLNIIRQEQRANATLDLPTDSQLAQLYADTDFDLPQTSSTSNLPPA